jgi:hypothetical protein
MYFIINSVIPYIQYKIRTKHKYITLYRQRKGIEVKKKYKFFQIYIIQNIKILTVQKTEATNNGLN